MDYMRCGKFYKCNES